METIEQKIENFYEETDNSVNYFIDGSDEHLDKILSITKPLSELTIKFKDFNEFLYSHLYKYSEDQLISIMPNLRKLNKSCLSLIGAIKTCYLYRDVRACFKEYSKQQDFLIEMIHDIHYFRLKKDEELDNLLKELNDM